MAALAWTYGCQQRAACAGASSISSGITLQAWSAREQRGAKAQPGGK
jgi:hypothetical protein